MQGPAPRQHSGPFGGKDKLRRTRGKRSLNQGRSILVRSPLLAKCGPMSLQAIMCAPMRRSRIAIVCALVCVAAVAAEAKPVIGLRTDSTLIQFDSLTPGTI